MPFFEPTDLTPLPPLTWPGRSLPIWSRGEGERLLLVLPGYRQTLSTWTRWLPEAPPGWRLLLLGLPGTVEPVDAAALAWQPSDWQGLRDALEARFAPQNLICLGYSLGGRLLLNWLSQARNGLHTILLVSPDGLVPSLGERWFLYRRGGYTALRWLIARPEAAKTWADRLFRWGVMNKSGHYFAMRQLRDPEGLRLGLVTVRYYLKAKPQALVLSKLGNSNTVDVRLIWGKEDRVRPLEQSERLQEWFPRIEFRQVSGGHTWPESHPELFRNWVLESLNKG